MRAATPKLFHAIDFRCRKRCRRCGAHGRARVIAADFGRPRKQKDGGEREQRCFEDRQPARHPAPRVGNLRICVQGAAGPNNMRRTIPEKSSASLRPGREGPAREREACWRRRWTLKRFGTLNRLSRSQKIRYIRELLLRAQLRERRRSQRAGRGLAGGHDQGAPPRQYGGAPGRPLRARRTCGAAAPGQLPLPSSRPPAGSGARTAARPGDRLHRGPSPQHRSWGHDRKLLVRNFRLPKNEKFSAAIDNFSGHRDSSGPLPVPSQPGFEHKIEP